jgi:hypothetical protein
MTSPSAAPSRLARLGLDLRLALRTMCRRPGHAIFSIALIAFALASATAIFSIVNGIVLTPLPRVRMNGLVRVGEYGAVGGNTGRSLSNETWYAWRDAPTTIDGLPWNDVELSYDGGSGVELVRGARVTSVG